MTWFFRNLFINEIESIDKKIAKEVNNIEESTKALEVNNQSKDQLFSQKNGYTQKIESLNESLQEIRNSFYEDKNEMMKIYNAKKDKDEEYL